MRFFILLFTLVIGTHSIFAQSMSASSAGASFPKEHEANHRTKRRLYGMCPPQFRRIGDQCYLLSDQKSNWLEAHFYCKDKNSKLAEPSLRSDRHLRKFLQHQYTELDKDVIWLGATYDWHNNVWQWSISGKNLTHNPFALEDLGNSKPLDNHCAVYDPELNYRWSARSCPDKHRFICEHKMPKVSEQNRLKVYNRWNQTYPNELANEVVLNVPHGKRVNRRGKALGDHQPRRNQNARHNSRPDVYLTHRSQSENDIDFPIENAAMAATERAQFARLSTGGPSTIHTNEIEGNNFGVKPRTEVPGQLQVNPKNRPIYRPTTNTNKQREPRINRRTKADMKYEHQREKERRRQLKRQEKQRKQLERKQKKDERQRRLLEERERMQQQQQDNEVVADQQDESRISQRTDTAPAPAQVTKLSSGLEERIQQEREELIREHENQRRIIDEENRQRFELQERERQEEIKRQQEVEEQRLRDERAEHMRMLEAKEQARLQEEAQKRAEKDKEREHLLSMRNKEDEERENEENRMLEEMKSLEAERRREHEQKIIHEEEANRQRELEARQKVENEAKERRQRLELAAKRARAEKLRKMTERIAKLSPEAQRQFLEERRKRKSSKKDNAENHQQQQAAQNQSVST